MNHSLPEAVTFESLRYCAPLLAKHFAQQEVPNTGIITLIDDDPQINSLALSSLSVELNNLYDAVYSPTRKFVSGAVQLRQMSDALNWLVGGGVDNLIGINSNAALHLLRLDSFSLAQLLLEQFERSDVAMTRLYGANVRALRVLDKLGNAAALMSADADEGIATLELRPAINKPLSNTPALYMEAEDLAHARKLYAQRLQTQLPWEASLPSADEAYTSLCRRLMPQKELLERHAKTPPSRLQAACGDIGAYLLGL